MKYIKKSFDFENREENEFGDIEFPNATLICPGSFRDSYSRKEIIYSQEILQKNAKNWKNPSFLTIDHSPGVLDRIGIIKNQHWDGKCIIGDLVILTITQKGKDAVNLIKRGMITDLSIEAFTNEEYDIVKKSLVINDIQFMAASLVIQGACPSAKIGGME